MLAQLASLASLACVRPLITHEAYQLARAEGSHPLRILASKKGRKTRFMSRYAGKILSQHLLVCKTHLKGTELSMKSFHVIHKK